MTLVSRLSLFCLALGSLSFASCGGVSKQAQIAASLQVVLANVIEGYATKETGSTTITSKCGNGTGDGGTMTYSIPAGLSDPAQYLAFIQSNGAVDLPLTFTNCVIDTCGATLTLNGPGSVTLDKDDVLAAITGSGEFPAAFSVKADGATATGLLEGTVTFAYKIKAVASSKALSSVTIEEASTPEPLEADGKTFEAKDIASLAEGC